MTKTTLVFLVLTLVGCADPLERVRGNYVGTVTVTACAAGSSTDCTQVAAPATITLTDSTVRPDGAEITFGDCYVHFDVGTVYSDYDVDFANAGGACGPSTILAGTATTAPRTLTFDVQGIAADASGLFDVYLHAAASR